MSTPLERFTKPKTELPPIVFYGSLTRLGLILALQGNGTAATVKTGGNLTVNNQITKVVSKTNTEEIEEKKKKRDENSIDEGGKTALGETTINQKEVIQIVYTRGEKPDGTPVSPADESDIANSC